MIRALTAQGLREVEGWLRASDEPLALSREHTREVASLGWDAEPLRALVTGPAGDPALDLVLAPALHAALPLGRGLASDRAVWAWLGAEPLHAVLRHRWPAPSRDRYVGSIGDHGLGRLWWAAELTFADGPDPYVDTRRLVRWQYLLHRLSSSRVVRSRTVMRGVLDVLAGTADWRLINGTIHQLGAVAATISLDALDRTEVAAVVRALSADVVARGEAWGEPG